MNSPKSGRRVQVRIDGRLRNEPIDQGIIVQAYAVRQNVYARYTLNAHNATRTALGRSRA
jgi:hypothetical protein